MGVLMNMELAYKVQMLPAKVRNDRSICERELLQRGWSLATLKDDLDAAMRWANSHCVVVAQEKSRQTRETKKQKIRGDDALDLMFASAGVDPTSIPRRT
jgi:hypothetical protein